MIQIYIIIYDNKYMHFGLEEATRYELFDFASNSWRCVTPASPYKILDIDPVYAKGFVYWVSHLIDTKDMKVVLWSAQRNI